MRVERPDQVRDFIIDWLRKELIGPAPGLPMVQVDPKGEEVLRPQDPPRMRYACGILFPRGVNYSAAIDVDDEEAAGVAGAETVDQGENGSSAKASEGDSEEIAAIDTGGVADAAPENDSQEVVADSQFLPSTMGVSFLVDVCDDMAITIEWATYAKRKVPGYGEWATYAKGEVPGHDERPDPVPQLWFRAPHLRRETLARDELLKRPHIRKTVSPADAQGCLLLDVVSRPWGGSRRLVTATLMNGNRETKPINENCQFQCGLVVEPGAASRIEPYPERPGGSLDDEEASLALLYRHRPTYAIGHGCAADWTLADGRVTSVRSEVLPVFQQPPVEAREELPGVELSMTGLASMETPEVLAACRALADAYERWIAAREADISTELSADPEMRRTAERHMRDCRLCLSRMRDGIELLSSDALVLDAFRGMNAAMVRQRAHYALSSDAKKRRGWTGDSDLIAPDRPYERPEYPARTRWRPFQIAFILMNLRAMRHPEHPSRSDVDVIWFPTGGGKTEAYLGLAAYTILLRRLLAPDNAGATVLMRYTLRLLTTQQFQRAASLICALELTRRSRSTELGAEPISIGLWLGSGVTPNRNAEAVADHSAMMTGDKENRFAVLSCPWCGIDMGLRTFRGGRQRVIGYRVVGQGEGRHVQFRCEDPDCEFSGEAGLPVEVVDEQIYQKPPTLVIGTVDKFAMLPWQPLARKLFGIDNPSAQTPPDLIIQDELHLIAGPLGSMVGHYETVVDELCTVTTSDGRRVPPRIVASTATIARADDQIWQVYGRKSFLFPPQALRAGESFFAIEGDAAAGRTYVGVFASAMPSHITAQKAVLAVLLQAPALCEGPAEAIDPYWSLMCYFNSLRELGRGATLVQADVREHLNAVWHRIGLTEAWGGEEAKARRRFVNNFTELTSRMRSSEIPAVLQELFRGLPDRDTVDLCFATNMIQVGLDVSRLSIMTIVGQPKGASEYIQASSRIGRDPRKPGLVVVNFNPFKPRDRSHFESFRPFHENAYRHVEPTSVTPFSLPVCERAIHALVVTLARFWDPALREVSDIGIREPTRSRVREVVLARVRTVAPDELARATAVLDRFLDDWDRMRPNVYGGFSAGDDGEPLMWPAGKPLPAQLEQFKGLIRATPSSMRNVDGECEAFRLRAYGTMGDVNG